MKKPIKVALGGALLLVLALGGFYAWASARVSRSRARTIVTHEVDFPVPTPLTEQEVAGLEPGADPDAIALTRAIERGEHLVSARYACVECHGPDFGGGVMVDDPMLGRFLGPNITTGQGSRTLEYTASDWDRIVRHGVRSDGHPSPMPAEDFQLMSDQELSDVVAYIRSVPPVDGEVEPIRLGPLGTILLATGGLRFAADVIPSHVEAHPLRPPAAEVSTDFGRHLAGICTGCHRPDLAGGPVPGGDPSWPPARNLTPHADGLEAWSYEDFTRAMLEGTRPDGTSLREPMSMVVPYARNMTEVERQALWTYLRSVPPLPTPE